MKSAHLPQFRFGVTHRVLPRGGLLVTWGVNQAHKDSQAPSKSPYHGSSSPRSGKGERHSPFHGTFGASEAFPLLAGRWMCWSSLWSSLWPWTGTHGWNPASHLRFEGPVWAEPCSCLVLRSFLASGKRKCKEIPLCLSTIVHFLHPKPLLLMAQETLYFGPYHLPPCSLGPNHTVLDVSLTSQALPASRPLHLLFSLPGKPHGSLHGCSRLFTQVSAQMWFS